MAFIYQSNRPRIGDRMAAGDVEIKRWLTQATFAKTSNGFWIAWHSNDPILMAVLPPEHPVGQECLWIENWESSETIESLIEYVESGRFDSRKPTDFSFSLHGRGVEASKVDNAAISFNVATVSPNWHVKVFIHSTGEAQRVFLKDRPRSRHICGQTRDVSTTGQKEGVFAEIHLVAAELSELTIVHEAIHASSQFARNIGLLEAKKLAAPFTTANSTMAWRDEILCRTTETVTMGIIRELSKLGVPCIALRDSSL